jgi:hypothetical protein
MRSEAMQEAHLGRDINAEFALIGRLVEGLKDRGFGTASLGLVLGSGLKDFGKRIHDPLKISLTELPGLPSPKVAGHGCELLQGEVAGVNVHVLTGACTSTKAGIPGKPPGPCARWPCSGPSAGC